MPVRKTVATPPHSHPDLAEALAEELRTPHEQGAKGIPNIVEEAQTFGGRIHVTVLWDKWANIPHSERGAIVLDAYRQAKGEREMLNITLAQGFTIEEHALWRSRRAQEEQDNA